MRSADIKRDTAETQIELSLNLDGKGESELNIPCGFLTHMLTLFARHSGFDLKVNAMGDTFVDDHHLAEDLGICLGKAFKEALGDMKGITRYGFMLLPMDEALIETAVDISGRPYLSYKLDIPTEKVGTFDTELIEEFFISFVRNADITLHIISKDGKNSHHIIEGAFKSVARTLRRAVEIDERFANEIPSTKGVL
jgi:imidazoleglycerol-phosphate dehydratase